MTTQQHDRLLAALTEYDRKQSTKRGYNHYALAHYMAALGRAQDAMREGCSIREALLRCFNDRLLDCCLKAVGEAKYTREEMYGR